MSTPGEMEKHAAAEVKYTGNSSAEAMRMTEGDKHGKGVQIMNSKLNYL